MKIVYHNDADGKCAGFWVRELAYAKELAYVTEYIGYIRMDYGRKFPFDKIKKNETVYIVDYSIEPSEMDKLLKITPNVTWIDHHISAIKKYENYDKEIRGVRYNGVAGCMLTYCYLKHMTNSGIGDIKPFEESMTEDAPMFTKLIADYDVWTFKYGHSTKEFHAGFKALPNTEPTSNWWLKLNDPVYGYGATDFLIKEGISRIQYRKETMTHYCETFGFEVMFNGYKCFAVNMGMMSSDDFVIGNIDDYDMLIGFVFNGHEWRYSLRSTKVDCSKVAMLYGGGGHKGAAGFNTKECVLGKGDDCANS